MPRLKKADLLREVEWGFQAGGWSIFRLTPAGHHPALFRVEQDRRSLTVKVYIWNVTHGGGTRSASEYRIQVTGITPQQFDAEPNGKTLILGFWEHEEVFAGFDYRRHTGPLGGSPSLQIGEEALRDANQHRFALHEKGSGELAVAFKPDFIGTYAENLEALHDTGTVPAEVTLLTRIAETPDAVADTDIVAAVAAPRQQAVTVTRRALRALDFKARVLTAYGHKCAVCGIQLRLIDGAHIVPVCEPGSTDETSNGVALCALHHRAYDRGLITFDEKYRVRVHAERMRQLKDAGHDARLTQFQAALRSVLLLPPSKGDRPEPAYVKRANTLRGWR